MVIHVVSCAQRACLFDSNNRKSAALSGTSESCQTRTRGLLRTVMESKERYEGRRGLSVAIARQPCMEYVHNDVHMNCL
jgi:hypothetical protein